MIAPSSNGFSNTVTLAATGLPQGAQATFSQNPVGAGATVTMTVTTTARSSAPPHFRIRIQPLGTPRALEIVGMLLAILVSISFRRQRRWMTAVPAGAL